MSNRNQANPRSHLLFPALIILLAFAGICTTVTAAGTADDNSPEAQVAITNITLDPEILMQDDQGTLIVRVTNSGTSPVKIDRVELLSEELRVVNYQTYDKVGVLGTDNSLSFTFLIDAGARDGTYFPIFYVDFTDSGSMRFPVAVKVDNTPLLVAVSDSPDTFSAGEEDRITISISNPRDNEVNSVTITPGGAGIVPSQTSIFVGSLKPDEAKQVTFGITPAQSTDLLLNITYRNGPNQHSEALALPVVLGDRKVAAELVVNNIEVTGAGPSMVIGGDVTNAGLKDARSVTVTVGEPARAVDPNPVYVIGSLEPDDFSSFEITCLAGGTSRIPLVVSYRDEEGRTLGETFEVSIMGSGNTTQGAAPRGVEGSPQLQRRPGGSSFGMAGFGSGISKIPFVPIILIILAGIGAVVAWRKGWLAELRERFQR